MSVSSTETEGPPAPGLAPVPDAVETDGVLLRRAVEYAVVPGHRPLLLDLYHPGTGTPPLVVFVHGGGWRAGTRGSVGPAFAGWRPGPPGRLAAAGYAVAALDYRLSGEATFPAALEDVRAALSWLRAHGDELGTDATRVVLWGESAGAHLAALAGLTDPDVAAVVAWYGPSDLTTLPADAAASGIAATDPEAVDSRESLFLGGPLTELPEAARQASPITHVTAGAPPFLLLHGDADRFVPARQSQRLDAALRAAGGAVRLELLPGADHLWGGRADAAQWAFGRTRDFIDDVPTLRSAPGDPS